MLSGASCGSRTGLFVDVPSDASDAQEDVRVADREDGSRDASVDAFADAPADAIVDASPDGPVACVPGTFAFQLAAPQLMFVLDRSGSMAYALDQNSVPPLGQPTRWTVLRDALQQTLTPLNQQIAMGARFFPAETANGASSTLACIQDPAGVAISPALGNANAILNVFFRTEPEGGTPTAVALDLAAREVSASRAVARAIVLATDGAPNCNSDLEWQGCACTSSTDGGCRLTPTNCLDDARTVATVTDIASNQKIPVYVIGIGATTSFGAVLDAMAIAGGRPRAAIPRYYPAETPAELANAFTLVRDSVAKCSYITPSSPNDPDAITVVVGGGAVARDPNHLDGWDWIDQAYGHLQLFGAACAAATTVNVSGTVGCERDR